MKPNTPQPTFQPSALTPAVQTPAAEQTGIAASVGRWIHRHKESPDKPVGFVVYQVIRNALAAVPYGIATVLVSDGFNKMTKSAIGPDAASPLRPGLAKFLKSPAKDIAMIAAGFTFYRGTLKVVRYMKERLFDPKDSEEQTIDEVRHIGSALVTDIKEIAPAEINSTPYGAIALGMGRRFLDGLDGYSKRKADHVITKLPPEPYIHKRTVEWNKDGFGISFKTPSGERGFSPWLKDFRNRVFSAKSMPFAEALTFIGSFLAFFELSDRLYKDVQVRRGVWGGEDNSLARKAPPKHPEMQPAVLQPGDVAHRGNHPSTFDGDPNLKSMVMGRILPTIFGIGAYTFTKRAAYHVMGHFAGKSSFWKRAFVEGAATSTFFVMSSSADLFEKLNKKLAAPEQLPQSLLPAPVILADAAPKSVISQPAISEGTVHNAPEKSVATA